MLVNYTRPNLSSVTTVSGASYTFIPGVNDVPNNIWSKLLENPHFKADVDAGIYKIETDDSDDIDVQPPARPQEPLPQPLPDEPAPFRSNSLQKLSQSEASRVVRETYDVPLLQEMRRSEDRRPVQEVIDAQVQRLKDERRARPRRTSEAEE